MSTWNSTQLNWLKDNSRKAGVVSATNLAAANVADHDYLHNCLRHRQPVVQRSRWRPTTATRACLVGSWSLPAGLASPTRTYLPMKVFKYAPQHCTRSTTPMTPPMIAEISISQSAGNSVHTTNEHCNLKRSGLRPSHLLKSDEPTMDGRLPAIY